VNPENANTPKTEFHLISFPSIRKPILYRTRQKTLNLTSFISYGRAVVKQEDQFMAHLLSQSKSFFLDQVCYTEALTREKLTIFMGYKVTSHTSFIL
jgi:hypothetical protein